MLYSMGLVGTRVCHMQNSPTTTSINSLKMAPFEALYGHKCRTPLFWNQTGETQVFGKDVLRHAEQQVRTIRDNLRVAQSRQKS